MPEERHRKGGGTYIHFTEQEIQDAKSISMIDFLYKEYGWTFERVGGYYRGKEHDSLMIKSDERSWWWNSQNLHGRNAFDWLTAVEHNSYTQALEKLIGSPTNTISENKKTLSFSPAPKVDKIAVVERKEFVIPEKADGKPSRAFAYLLKTRCLDSDVVSQMFHEKQIYQDVKGNVVFAGYDENNEMKFAERKLTNTYLANLKNENGKRQFVPINVEGSDKRYSFNVSVDKDAFPAAEGILYVFEAPVDLLSHATFKMMNERARAAEQGVKPDLHAWRNVNRLSLSGTSKVALDSYLERNPQINKIVFAMDYDAKGIQWATAYEKEYSERGYSCSKIKPFKGKDWNECLQLFTEEQRQREVQAEKNNSHKNDEIFVAQQKGGRK